MSSINTRLTAERSVSGWWLTPRTERLITAGVFVVLAIVYAVAWHLPAIGLFRDDGALLVTGRALALGHGYVLDSAPAFIPQTRFPPLFPAVLAASITISNHPIWLKLVPLTCTAAWLTLTWTLLGKLGASRAASWFLVFATAASPLAIHAGSNLFNDSMFAMLATGGLLVLMDGQRPFMAGSIAGLAALTSGAAPGLIATGILVFLLRGRARQAVRFTGAALLFAAPWWGWSMAAARRLGDPIGHKPPSVVFGPGIHLFDSLRVLAANASALMSAPARALTGFTSLLAVVLTGLLIVWALWRRRQTLPDLFVLFSCIGILLRVEPSGRSLLPALPLLLWIVCRSIEQVGSREAIAAIIILAGATELVQDFRRIGWALRAGSFGLTEPSGLNWRESRKFFEAIRTHTPQGAVLGADLDALVFLETGRHTMRGFQPNPVDLYDSNGRNAVSGYALLRSMQASSVGYLALMPDRDAGISKGFRDAAMALEREGYVEPVELPGVAPDYQLFHLRKD